jgi:hypothetical protein
MRRIQTLIAAVTALIVLGTATPALAVGCTGAGCVGQEPSGMGCTGATMQGVRPPGGGPQVFLRWASNCVANWARWDDSNPQQPYGWEWWVETTDGTRQNPLWPMAVWTFMVNGNLSARACIRGLATTGFACTRWY